MFNEHFDIFSTFSQGFSSLLEKMRNVDIVNDDLHQGKHIRAYFLALINDE